MRRRLRYVATLALSTGLLAACGSTGSASAGASKSVSAGGTVYFGEAAGQNPNYIFPFTPSADFSVADTSLFEYLMYRPLYFFGNGDHVGINYTLSLANPPVYSNGNTTVTITLRNYRWSNGTAVTARDVIFWMNLLKAEKDNWAAYVPGDFPDNVVSYGAPNAHTVVFHLNHAYNPTWFTYNELSQITPLPLAWDRTSMASSPATNASSALPDATPGGAKVVYRFLAAQSRDLATYATNPLWRVVDGPWRLESFTTQGKAVFVPNPDYSGPTRPRIKKFVELPFTSDQAEFNLLRSGALTYGYVPLADLSQSKYLASLGYKIRPWREFGFNYMVENYSNPTYGALFRQLYLRQALQDLVNQPAWVKTFLKGDGSPTYSPVPNTPSNKFADAASRHNRYPFSTAKAKSLLLSHGFVLRNRVMTCERAGGGPTDCGAGVKQGTALSFNMLYSSGVSYLGEEMAQFQSSAAQVGIKLNLSQAPYDQVLSDASPCAPSQASCTWQLAYWGIGWEYSPDNLPTGGELFGTGAGSNYGSWSDTETNDLITLTHTSADSTTALDEYQNYLAQELPVIYAPMPADQISAISTRLHGVKQNPYLNITPESWYF
ncbi:peptide ABC transporter substrate-binding protein [Ferrimicrobium sp.]|uniref:peptide ABC transporter substrate-binding protein n=1 Tax=Ferrimicrobium sp. TaxID=2926050 RepID=UPI002626C967|nr:peptide ABC transporter substrate-binding protein [Ferrimicrobium sp.]